MIEFHNVSVCYEPDKRHPVRSLDGLSLKIERGDWVFLVGPSGAGKSSLMKLIFADLRAQGGQVLVDGADISRITDAEIPALRRKIGIVFQDYQLLSQKTAWENVAFALRVIGTPQSQIVREVPRALETVGLTHRAEAFPHQLSGGEQQRIAIARAIVNDPLVLLADEPTGNLDPQTAREVGQLLTKINRERGTTIVMATHDGAFVDELRRRVVRLKDGRVVSDKNPGQYAQTDDATRDHFFSSPAPQKVSDKVPASDNGAVLSPDAGAPSADRTASSDNRTAPSDNRTASSDNRTASSDNGTASSDNGTASSDNGTASSDNGTASSADRTGSSADRTASSVDRTASSSVLPRGVDVEFDDLTPAPRPMARRLSPEEIDAGRKS